MVDQSERARVMLRHMIVWTRGVLLATAVALLLTACSEPPTCTAAGASDFVRVDLRQVPFAGLATPVVADVCLDGFCRPRQPIVGKQVFFAGGEDFIDQKLTRVEVKVYSAGSPARRATAQVQPEEFAPNGKECGPVVSQVHVKFDANNTLRQAPADSE